MLLDDTLWERTFAEYERGSTSVDDASRSSPNRSVARSPARSSIVRRFTKDCIFNVNVYNRVFSRHTPVYSTRASLSLVRKRLSLTSQTLNPNSYVTCSKTFVRRFKRTTMRRGVLDAFSRHRGQRRSRFPSLSRTRSNPGLFSRRRTRSHPLLVLLARVLSTSGNPVRLKIPLAAMRRASRFSRAKGGFIRDVWDGPRTVRPPPSPPLLFLENGASRTTGTRVKARTPSRATACFWITRTYTR